MSNLLKKIQNAALATGLALSSLTSNAAPIGAIRDYSPPVETRVPQVKEEQFEGKEMTPEEKQTHMAKLNVFYNRMGDRVVSLDGVKLKSKTRPEDKIYLVNLDIDGPMRRYFGGLSTKEGNIYLIFNGLKEKETQVRQILEEPASTDAYEDAPEARIQREFVRKEFKKYNVQKRMTEEEKSAFQKEFVGTPSTRGFMREVLMEERIGAGDLAKGLGIVESEDRQQCLKIIYGRPFFNLGENYLYSMDSNPGNPYKLSQRYIKFLWDRTGKNPETFSAEQLRNATKEYLIENYPDGKELIERFKDF